ILSIGDIFTRYFVTVTKQSFISFINSVWIIATRLVRDDRKIKNNRKRTGTKRSKSDTRHKGGMHLTTGKMTSQKAKSNISFIRSK
ncbi:hypothetical protein RUM43_000346, partial [Polyplax serrata]